MKREHSMKAIIILGLIIASSLNIIASQQQFSCLPRSDELLLNDSPCLTRLFYNINSSSSCEHKNTSSLQEDEITNNLVSKIKHHDSNQHWRFKYIDEQSEEFNVIFVEDSLDTRLSNVIYTVGSTRLINIDVKHVNLGNKNKNEHYKRLGAGASVDHSLCGQEINLMLDLLEELEQIVESKRANATDKRAIDERHIRLAKVLDSFGHYEAGLLAGKTHFTGTYPQCSGSHLMLSPGKRTKMRYCSALLDTEKHLDESLKKRVKSEHEPLSVITVGVCLPSSCHSSSFDSNKHLLQKLIDTQFKLPKSLFIEEHLEMVSLYCEPDEDSELARLPLMGKLFVAFVVSWMALTFYATIKGRRAEDSAPKKGNISRFLRCFDLKHSWNEFIGEPKKNISTRVQLDALNPVKVLGSALVVFGHSYMQHGTIVFDVLKGYHLFENDPYVVSIISCTLFIDTFYVMSGLLITFVALRKLKNANLSGKFNFLKFSAKLISARYLRLVPMYALIFWFQKSIFPTIGNGPLWDSSYNKETSLGSCRQEGWITPFSFLAAYRPLARQCLPQTWSVANDISFVLVMAPIIVTLSRKPKLAAFISMIICLASSWLMYISMSVLDESVRHGMADVRLHAYRIMFEEASWIYTVSHHRIFSGLVGVLAGYMLYKYNESEKINKWPQWLTGSATKVAICFSILMFFTPSFVVLSKSNLAKTFPIQYYLNDIIMTFGRLGWAVASAIIVLRMTTDWQDSFFVKNCAGNFWKTLAKLSYATLLIHVAILTYDVQIQQTLSSHSRYHVFSKSLSAYATCCLFSSILYVAFESPMDKIVKLLISGSRDRGLKSNIENDSLALKENDAEEESKRIITRC